ncbi:MAG: Guanosine-5'-triphosphate,3'-diphosphate pyrophosphatase [Alphaproteobacteria bacterium MarineAlpha10_Bin1]|nr:MAG: Guanosine-5'-triphosphate,3'-diphosphate pyrophosphatase [Alphaproteobacteria bacterium MarineAlpha10_Bin1]
MRSYPSYGDILTMPGAIAPAPLAVKSATQAPVAIIDIGSNSVRLVVYDGAKRAPIPVFNEKVLCGLGRGLDSTGRLNPEGAKLALESLHRFAALTQAMGVSDIDAFATAAVREATDASDFVAVVERDCGFPVRVISGVEEARLSALGVLAEIPQANGIMGDLGGASLELAHLEGGTGDAQTSLPIGPLRIASGPGDPGGASASDSGRRMEDYLNQVDWLSAARGGTFYAVGGAWRSWARMHMRHVNYPLSIAHHYEISARSALEFAREIAALSPDALANFAGFPEERADSVPFANLVLKRLIEQTGVAAVLFSAYGVREGLIFDRLPDSLKSEDPLIAACRNLAAMTGRATADGEALYRWASPAFADETIEEARLRRAACLLADLEWSEHPDYRAEHALLRILRYPLIGVDHPGRAYMGLAVASRHAKVRDSLLERYLHGLLDGAEMHRAKAAGLAMRLAYTFSGGVISLLEQTALRREGNRLKLELPSHADVLVGNVVQSRFRSLAQELGCEARISLV